MYISLYVNSVYISIQNIETEYSKSALMQSQPSQTIQVSQHNIFQSQKPSQFYLRPPYRILTQFMSGGLHTGMLTQIYGQSGSGKTQLAMLFSISAIYQDKLVGYLATDKDMHWGRFVELAYQQMNESEFDQKQNYFRYKKSIDDYQAQNRFIQNLFKDIKQTKQGGLLVIDNVCAFINASFTFFKIQNNFQKARKQAQIMNKLRKYAKTTNTCVLLINRVSDVVQKRRKSLGGRSTVPALGAAWQLNVDQSFQLKKGERSDIRQLNVICSPKCADGKLLLRIQQDGFVFIDKDGVQYRN